MDPFSLTVGALALAQTGTTLTTLLLDLGKDVRSASAAMAEVASDVQITSTLLTDLAYNLEVNPTGYSEKFLASAKNLCDQCKGVFDDIQGIVGRDRGVDRGEWLKRVGWAVKGKRGVGEKQERLRQLQFMFLFVSQIEMLGSGASNAPVTSGAELTAGSLEGQLIEVPVRLSGSSEEREPARYMATLTLKPAPPTKSSRTRTSAAQDTTAGNRCLLVNMRRSPRFSADLLDPRPKEREGHSRMAVGHMIDELIETQGNLKLEAKDVGPRIPSQKEAEEDIDNLLARWSNAPPNRPKQKSPSSRPSSSKEPPSPRPKPPSVRRTTPPRPNTPPTRKPTVRIHEAPGLPAITSYGPEYTASASPRRPQADLPTLRVTAQGGGMRRPRSEEIPRERVTRYYINQR